MVGRKGDLRFIEVSLAVGQEDVIARCEPEHPDGMRRLLGGKFLQGIGLRHIKEPRLLHDFSLSLSFLRLSSSSLSCDAFS